MTPHTCPDEFTVSQYAVGAVSHTLMCLCLCATLVSHLSPTAYSCTSVSVGRVIPQLSPTCLQVCCGYCGLLDFAAAAYFIPYCSKETVGAVSVGRCKGRCFIRVLRLASGCEVLHKVALASSTAQGGGGSFKNGGPIGKVVVNHGWQSASTDGPKGGWSCVFWNGCNGCSGRLTHNCSK